MRSRPSRRLYKRSFCRYLKHVKPPCLSPVMKSRFSAPIDLFWLNIVTSTHVREEQSAGLPAGWQQDDDDLRPRRLQSSCGCGAAATLKARPIHCTPTIFFTDTRTDDKTVGAAFRKIAIRTFFKRAARCATTPQRCSSYSSCLAWPPVRIIALVGGGSGEGPHPPMRLSSSHRRSSNARGRLSLRRGLIACAPLSALGRKCGRSLRQ